MAEEDKKADVTVTSNTGAAGVTIDAPVTPAAAPGADEKNAASFQVSDAQFEKYYDKDKRAYNWEGHARELTWQATQKGGDPASDEATKAVASDTDALAAVKEAGLDIASLEQEIIDDGKLSADSLKALADVGIPETTAQGYTEYLVNTAKAQVEEVKTHLGGDAGIATLKNWAMANLKPEEILTYEEKLSGPEWRIYADSLKARAGVRAGSPENIIHGANEQPGASGQAGYKNDAEQQADIRNPKYRTDPNFRAMVMARTRASDYTANVRTHTVGA